MEPTPAFIGSELLASGLTPGELRWRYRAVHPRVYVPRDAVPSLRLNTVAAWLWTGRRSVIAGLAAAALHGAGWIDDDASIELITAHGRRRPDVIVREALISPDEICNVDGMPVTTPARTALDLARHFERDDAVSHLDALAAATGITADDTTELAARYRSTRGMRQARVALDLMDGGAQSPKETWLRLLLIDAGYPRPRTQLHVTDGFANAFIDMGWDGPKIGLDYDGKLHQTDRKRFVRDIGRNALIQREGWIDIHVVAEHGRAYILHRVREACDLRGWHPVATSTAR